MIIFKRKNLSFNNSKAITITQQTQKKVSLSMS